MIEAGCGRARLRVDQASDAAEVLAVAQSSGEIVSFTYQPPTLSELFRRAVAA